MLDVVHFCDKRKSFQQKRIFINFSYLLVALPHTLILLLKVSKIGYPTLKFTKKTKKANHYNNVL